MTEKRDRSKDGLTSQLGEKLVTVRACRLAMAKVLREAYTGKRRITDIPKFAQGFRALSDFILTENLLKGPGGSGDPSLDDAPLDMEPEELIERHVKVRKGVDRYGAEIEETTVTYDEIAKKKGPPTEVDDPGAL